MTAILLLRFEFPVDRRVDQNARPLPVAILDRIPFFQRHAGIEHGAGGARKYRNVTEPGVEPVTQRPFDRFPIVNIDIVIDDDEVLPGIIRQVAAP